MTPNSSNTSYISAADMILRHDPRLMAQLCSDNPYQPVIYSPLGPASLAGNVSLINASGQIAFTIPQSGIQGSTCQFAGDASAQTYLVQTGNVYNFIISPVYGGVNDTTTCQIVPTDTLSTNQNFLTVLSEASGELESACLRSQMYSVSDLQSLNGVSLQYMKKILSNIAMMNLYTRRDGPNPPETTVENYNSAMKMLEDLSGGMRIFAFNETEEAGLPKNYYMSPWNQIRNRMVSSTWQRSFGIRQNMQSGYYGYGGNGNGGIQGNQGPL